MEAQTPAVETTPAETGPEPAAPPRRFAWGFWIFLTVGLVAAMGACDVYNFDVGLHLAKGRWILEHHSLPRPEEFITAKRPGFLYQERWLFQVGTWIVYSIGGWAGLTLVKIGFILLTFALLWTGSRPAGPAACVFATLLVSLLMYDRWDIRSELGIHVVYAAMIALASHEGPPGKRLWLAPMLAALGANLHSVNIGAPMLLLVPAVASWWRGERGAAKSWGVAWAASLGALLLNPQGWNIFRIPVEYLWRANHGPDWYRGYITEMQPVSADLAFPSITLRAVWIVIPLAALLLAANRKRARLFDVALLVLGAAGAFSIRRNIGFAGVLVFPVLARNAHHLALAAALRLPAASAAKLRFAANASLAAAVATVALLWTTDLPAIAERDVRREGLGISHLSLPVDACDFLEREGFQGDAFVNWEAGPYYNLRRFPRSLPSMNAEGDWNLETLKEFNDASDFPGENFDTFAARYNLQVALLTTAAVGTQRAILWLARSPGWALVWRDECAVVYARRDGPNAERVARIAPGRRLAAAPSCQGTDPGGAWPWSEGRRRSAAIRACRLGILHALFGEPEQRDCYERALHLWPGYAEAHGRLGFVLGVTGQAGADEEFREAIRLAPKYANAWMNLRGWYATQKDLDGAIRTLEAGLREVDDPDLMVQLARDLLARRQDAESVRRARELVERALKRRPGHAGAEQIREALDAPPAGH